MLFYISGLVFMLVIGVVIITTIKDADVDSYLWLYVLGVVIMSTLSWIGMWFMILYVITYNISNFILRRNLRC